MSVHLETENTEAFQAALEKQYLQISSADPMQKMKAKAWEYFLHLGLPDRRHEAYRYLRLRHLFSQPYAPSYPTAISREKISTYIYPECTKSVLVFVNGHYQPLLSDTSALPKRLNVAPLPEAMRTYGTFLNNQWTKAVKEEGDPFAVLNAALHADGVFLYVPPKTIVEHPLQILHLIDTATAPMLILPRLNVFIGAHSQIDIITSHATLAGTRYCTNQASDIALEEGARLRYIQSNDIHASADCWHFEAVRAHQKRDSHLTTVYTSEGCAASRYNYHVSLAGENSEASLNGLWMLNGSREAHTHVTVDHQAPNCRSQQLYKGVLDDASRSSFEGKILVQQEAQKTDAFQLNNNLVLSDRAQANSKPNLEIFADDVKASHGSTVGQLDGEQLFYMNARGFSDAAAKNMLVYSFCQEVIDLIPLPSLQESIRARAKASKSTG